MNQKSPKKIWARVFGPAASVLLHILLVVVLLQTIGFVSREKSEELKVDYIELRDFTLDPLDPVDPPEIPEVNSGVTPLSPEELSSLVEAPDVSVETEAFDDVSLLDNLSPLILKDIGADVASRGTLTSMYGDRAARNGLLGSYFNRIDFTGRTFTRIDPTLNYFWELESPWDGKIDPETFSVIWTGRIVPPRSGRYTFYLESDDGARLWIEGKLVLDQFVERERKVDTVEMDLLVGKSYDIKYAFCDAFHHAVSKLEWSCESAGIARQLIPSKHMWADGEYSRQMVAWNKVDQDQTGYAYPNRNLMRNPAMIEGEAFSHIVGFKNLSDESLSRLDLSDLKVDFNKYERTGRPPSDLLLPAVPPEFLKQQASPDDKTSDVTIEIL